MGNGSAAENGFLVFVTGKNSRTHQVKSSERFIRKGQYALRMAREGRLRDEQQH